MIAVARDVLDVLVATLWQGALIAIAVAAILALAGRGLNAATRSIVWQTALAAIVIVPLVTTLPHVIAHAAAVDVAAAAPFTQHGVARADDAAIAGPRRIEVALSDRVAIVLGAAWIAGVLSFALRLAAGSLQLARLVRRSIRLADRGGVHLYASPDISVPLAYGLAAPSVVVPVALAANAGEEFECIVLHELAHVRRRDAWSNACERVLQTFLFFNPAVVLVLRAIALERESACDDWAVAHSPDLDAYTRSLASFAVRGAGAKSVAACGVTGFGGATVTRIRRLEDAHRNGAVTLSKFALGGFTIVLLFLTLTLVSFAPAIAFAPQTPAADAVIASAGCHHQALRLPPGHHMKNFDVKVDLRRSPTGRVTDATVVKSSGDPEFDRALVAELRKTVPCKKPLGATSHFDLQSKSLTT